MPVVNDYCYNIQAAVSYINNRECGTFSVYDYTCIQVKFLCGVKYRIK